MTAIAANEAGMDLSVVGAPVVQATIPALEDITAGAPVRLDPTTGKFRNGNGTTSTEADVWGIALRSVKAGEALTAVRRGLLAGFALSGLNFGALVYVSDTDGRLDTAAGTVTKVIGRVFPGTAVSRGQTYQKLLMVEVG